MSLGQRKYASGAGIFIVLSILTSPVYAISFDETRSSELIFILTALCIFIAYYFFILIKEKNKLTKENKQLHFKQIEDARVIDESTKALQLEKDKVKKFSMVIEQSHDAIMVTDAEGSIEYINDKFTEITGYEIYEILGKNSRLVQPQWVAPENEKEFLKTLEKGCAWRSEVNYRKKDGEPYWAFESVSFIKDMNGEVIHYLATHRDISKEHQLSEQLSFQASHDDLTGLVNRREFEIHIDKLLLSAKEAKAEHALCFIDLDQFKIVNDTCGHVAGDELLRQLSSILMNTVRKRDTLARLGGDEFGILIEHCSLENAYHVTTSLLNAVQNFQFSWENRTFKLGASIGLVPIKGSMFTRVELLKVADAACYMAKDAGRNRIHVYHADDSDMVQRQGEMQWVTRITEALDKDLFCLYAQIIAPTTEGANNHYELLIRMKDMNDDIIPPGAFLPCAERYNLISKLDRWVITNAFKLLASNVEFQQQINFCSINLSGQSLTEDDFLDFVIESLIESGVQYDKVCFEITETAAISNLNIAVEFISVLKKMGCRFALDDFGSGLSSFGYLKNLPVDYLKIDGMFVKDIVDDPIDRAMVKSINEIGHVMGMKTIAEFVENDEIKEMLKDLSVDYVQGYGIGKPLPLSDLFIEQDDFNIASNY
jgi:diguanylate cyclase (GGDEF)-like protein/PAS domain S-box-containing protein